VVAIVISIAGALVVAVALADVFYTVLFPASGRGPVRRPLSRAIDNAFRLTRRLPGRWRRRALAYAGPLQVAATLLAWFALLLLGWAAIYRPALGAGVVAATGRTDDSWGTAIYYSGYTLTTLGLGDVVAVTPAYRVLTVVEAATGFVTFTLVISYFVSVYTTLTGRNAFALALHQRSGGTGRGVDIVRALWNEGPVSAAVHLAEVATDLRGVVQTHSSYPVLRSFHYQHQYDALPRILQTCWETVVLLRTTVDVPDSRPELVGSSLAEIAASAEDLCARVSRASADERPAPAQRQRWAADHARLVAELANAGIPVRQPSAAAAYVDARASWDPAVAALADELLYDWPPTADTG
jgi:hypothetical protein